MGGRSGLNHLGSPAKQQRSVHCAGPRGKLGLSARAQSRHAGAGRDHRARWPWACHRQPAQSRARGAGPEPYPKPHFVSGSWNCASAPISPRGGRSGQSLNPWLNLGISPQNPHLNLASSPAAEAWGEPEKTIDLLRFHNISRAAHQPLELLVKTHVSGGAVVLPVAVHNLRKPEISPVSGGSPEGRAASRYFAQLFRSHLSFALPSATVCHCMLWAGQDRRRTGRSHGPPASLGTPRACGQLWGRGSLHGMRAPGRGRVVLRRR